MRDSILIIFDCDGVLIDSEIIAARVQASLMTKFGVPITSADIARRFAGVPDKAMWASLEREFGVALPLDLPDQYDQALGIAFRDELRPIPGIKEALSTIQRIGLQCCVASSSTPSKLHSTLHQVGLWDYFSPNIFSTTQVARGKPSPDVFLFAAQQMRIKPAKCLVIEDSVAGVLAAHAAGMRVIGYVGGSHNEQDQSTRLLAAGAFETFDDMANLPTRCQYLIRSV